MKTILLSVLSTSAAISVIALLCLLLAPVLEKRYAPKGLYAASVLVVVAYLIPYSLLIPKPLVSVTVPQELTQPMRANVAMVDSNRLPLPAADAGDETAAAAKAAHSEAEGSEDAAATPVLQTVVSTQPAAVQPIQVTQEGVVYDHGGTLRQRLAAINWLCLLGMLWLVGAVVALSVQLLQHHAFVRTLRRWRQPCTLENYQQVLRQEAAGIRTPIALYLCPTVPSPMLLGLLRPAIYLPDAELSQEELALVIRHELTHYRRRDLVVKCLLLLCRAVHWFNPVMLPLSRWLCYCQEASCDANVTANANEEDRRFYAETIIRVIRRQVQARTQLCTSFYGGKNGMKNRLLSIMSSAHRRRGLALCLCLVALMVFCGGALALEGSTVMSFPQNAWVHAQNGTGTILSGIPSANDMDCPMGIYLNGTPVVIVQVTEGSMPGELDGQPHWAEVLIGGDGYDKGIHGWMPLRDLALESTAVLPEATLQTGDDSGHTQLYAINDRETPVSAMRPDGTTVQVLGQLSHWLHVSLDGEGHFVLLNNTQLSEEADQQLYDLLPERFGYTSRYEYDADHQFNKLYNEKAAIYGGKPLLFWSVEDKAWYGQLEEEFLRAQDHYYLMPCECDLPQDKAIELALEAYGGTEATVTLGDVDAYPGFYSMGYTEPRYWDIYLTQKGTTFVVCVVTISSPEGEVLDVQWLQYEAAPDGAPIPSENG